MCFTWSAFVRSSVMPLSCVGFAYEQKRSALIPCLCGISLYWFHYEILECYVYCWSWSCNKRAVASCVYTCWISVKYIESEDGSMLCRIAHRGCCTWSPTLSSSIYKDFNAPFTDTIVCSVSVALQVCFRRHLVWAPWGHRERYPSGSGLIVEWLPSLLVSPLG
jgi:hypothetical protein